MPLFISKWKGLAKRGFGLTLLVLLLGSLGFSQARAQASASTGANGLEDKIRNLLQQPKWDSAFWGIEIASLDDGKTVYALNAQKRFVPASNMKILTCGAVFDGMDIQETITTPVYATGRLDKRGRILGDLVFVGRGDPNLEKRQYTIEHSLFESRTSPSSIHSLVDQLQSKGVRSIEGNIIVDDTYFLRQPYGAAWAIEDSTWSYATAISALVVNENMIAVKLSPGEKPGDLAQLQTAPSEIAWSTILNRVRTVDQPQKTSISLTRDTATGFPLFLGTLLLTQSDLNYQVAAPDPVHTAGLLLKAALSQRGILVKGEVKLKVREATVILESQELTPPADPSADRSAANEAPVASIQGLPIVESLKIMMKESQNLYAECLLRLLGARTSGEGSIETGLAALAKFMAKTGTPENNLRINDASGISRKNLVTPDSLVKVLVYMDHHPLREKFLDMFPVAGKDGSLRTRFQSTPAAGRIQAKTGTMEGISTLSGYATTRQGSRLAFSLMMNNGAGAPQDVRDALDQICVWIVDWSPKPQDALKSVGQAQ